MQHGWERSLQRLSHCHHGKDSKDALELNQDKVHEIEYTIYCSLIVDHTIWLLRMFLTLHAALCYAVVWCWQIWHVSRCGGVLWWLPPRTELQSMAFSLWTITVSWQQIWWWWAVTQNSRYVQHKCEEHLVQPVATGRAAFWFARLVETRPFLTVRRCKFAAAVGYVLLLCVALHLFSDQARTWRMYVWSEWWTWRILVMLRPLFGRTVCDQ